MLAVQFSFTVCTGAAVPVPVKLVTAGEFDALLANEAVAVADPDAAGVNFTVKLTGVPGATVTGNEIPVIENSDGLLPPSVTDETLTFPPLAVSEPVAVPFVPTTTLPTATVPVELSVFCVAAADDPLSPMFRLGSVAFDVTAIFPVKLPAEAGVKITLNETV